MNIIRQVLAHFVRRQPLHCCKHARRNMYLVSYIVIEPVLEQALIDTTQAYAYAGAALSRDQNDKIDKPFEAFKY